jgi:hypothetical protein
MYRAGPGLVASVAGWGIREGVTMHIEDLSA